ncbi:MAG: hypothetical protein AB7O62_00170 [Pirellulales bacterium]
MDGYRTQPWGCPCGLWLASVRVRLGPPVWPFAGGLVGVCEACGFLSLLVEEPVFEEPVGRGLLRALSEEEVRQVLRSPHGPRVAGLQRKVRLEPRRQKTGTLVRIAE